MGDGSYDEMRREAVAAARAAGIGAEDSVSDIAPVGSSDGLPRRSVLLATASAAELSAALAPVRAAGLTIDRVLTPAAALVSVSRLYESVPGAGTIEAYVALDETAVALAIVRDNRLVAARDLPWGVLEEGPEGLAPRDYEALAARLGDELAALLPVGRLGPEGVSRICVCGGTPDLRSVAVLLIDRFDIEVEALDSLFGIDLRRLPYSLLEVRHELPALRLAWAAAVGGRPLLDLRRDVWRQVARRRWIRSAVAAGVVAGLGIGWTVAGQLPASTSALTGRLRRQLQTMMSASPSSSSNRAPDVATAPRRDEGPRTSAQAPGAPAPLPQAEASSQPAPPVEREVPVNRAAPPPQMPSRPSAQAVAKALPAPPPARVIEEPRQLAAQLPQPEPRRIAPQPAPPAEVPRPAARPPVRPPEARPEPAEIALPFDAILSTILFGTDRQLAIVDGRVVRQGDQVKGARVVQITESSVFLRDADGRLHELTVGTASGR